MGIQILVAKYVPDTRRWEPQNVGVVVVTDAGAYARFKGERPDRTIDKRRIGTAPPDVYAQWVGFWRRSLDAGATGLQHAIERSVSNYLLMQSSEVILGAVNVDPASLVDRYFAELVESVGAVVGPELSFDEAADQLLQRAGVSALPTFKQRVAVPSSDLQPMETFLFHYSWVNGHHVVAQRISLGDAEGIDAVNWRFTHLDRRQYHRVALVRQAPQAARAQELEAQLLARADIVVDIESETATTRLAALAR